MIKSGVIESDVIDKDGIVVLVVVVGNGNGGRASAAL